MFTIHCIECGDEVGTTTCEITATSMTLCEACQMVENGMGGFKVNPNHVFKTKHIS